MNEHPRARWEDDNRRNERIRQLRAQRAGAEGRASRRFQPVILIAWFAGVAALAAFLIFIGFLAFAPRLIAWVESNPGSIKQGIVLEFVRWYQPSALADTPVDGKGGRITVVIPLGASDSDIARLLYDKGLVRSQLAFEYWVIEAGRQGSLQAGTYDLSPNLTPSEIVAALRQESGPEVTIRIGEGWRLEQIVAYLSTTRLTMNLGEFVKLVTNPPADLVGHYAFLKDLPVGRTLEGYLFPDTYRIFANASAREVVQKLLDDFNTRVTPALRAAIAKRTIGGRQMTLDQAVRIASIVEREAVKANERPLIAGVYLNRLNSPTGETAGLLNADPTLQYGLATDKYLDGKSPVPFDQWDTVAWWAPLDVPGDQVSFQDKRLAGYQTYLNPGLPPGPIAAPSLASLQAVANASTSSGYLYFVAACPNGQRDGSHYFATTLAQQQANIAKARAECPAS